MTRPRVKLPRFLRTTRGAIGLVVSAFVVAVALIGPLLAPHGYATPIGAPGAPPYAAAPLGTDYLGRDVLSRVLDGGLSVIWIGGAATLASYLVGLTIGLVAGYNRTLVDPILMRIVDVLLSFPALLLMLLFVGGLGANVGVLILGVTLVQLPGIARVMRTATLEISTRGYVEAAVSRGERTSWVLRREILPNIAPALLADLGVRFSYSIILVASMNYLGLGLQPPAPDWGVMMAENRSFVSLNVWSVLAPAIMLGLLTIGVNLMADAYVRTSTHSSVKATRGRFIRKRVPRTSAID